MIDVISIVGELGCCLSEGEVGAGKEDPGDDLFMCLSCRNPVGRLVVDAARI